MCEGQQDLATVMEMSGTTVKLPPATVKHSFTKDDIKDQKMAINHDRFEPHHG